MIKFSCFLNKSNKKISYPEYTTIDPLFNSSLRTLPLITNELKSGEIILVEYFDNKITRVYKIYDNNLEQIYGENNQYENEITVKLYSYIKKTKIEEYINLLYLNLTLSELISNKHDLNDFQKELTKYLLLCKSKEKLNYKNIRSVVFKNCKNVQLVEKICLFLKKNPYNYFINDVSILKINFNDWSVQFIYD
jgi:hypothetical protein